MSTANWINLLVFWPLLASGLLLPGCLLGRIVRSSAPWLSAFLGSAVLLFHLVLALDAWRVPLGPTSVAAGLAALNGLLFLLARKSSITVTPLVRPCEKIKMRRTRWLPQGTDWLWLLAAGIGLTSITVRAVVEPLSGWDNLFRWDFLARQMLRLGTLSFYPPMTAGDFLHYGWCDGIPPLVPVLNFWTYLSAGQAAAVATAPRVVGEAVLLFYGVGRLASFRWGKEAAWPARAALATSALMLWGVAMGQETGLTALTLVAMFVFLDEHGRSGARADLFWAGLAAGGGALCREYGLAWPVFGLIALAWSGRLRAGWMVFSASAALVAVPWYLRNWILTGNPLYSHDLAGLFPTNAAYVEYMRLVPYQSGIRANLESIPYILALLVACAGLLGGLAVWGTRQGRRSAVPLAVGAVGVGAIWFWTMGQTSGGWYYSTRVLTPALALAAALAGATLVRLTGWPGRIVAGGLLLFAGDAAFRAFHLPNNPLPSPRVLFSSQWRDFGREVAARNALPWWDALAARAGKSGIVVDHPVNFVLLAERGACVIPLMSPQVAFLFDDRLPFAEALARCRQAGVRFFILPDIALPAKTLEFQHAFFRELCGNHQPAFVFQGMHVYDLDKISP